MFRASPAMFNVIGKYVYPLGWCFEFFTFQANGKNLGHDSKHIYV